MGSLWSSLSSGGGRLGEVARGHQLGWLGTTRGEREAKNGLGWLGVGATASSLPIREQRGGISVVT